MEYSPRQKEIIDTAIRLIEQGGLETLTTKRLAAEIGVSEAALYRHFTGKHAILLGILETFEAETRRVLDKMQGRSGSSPLDTIRAILLERARSFETTPALVVLLFSEEIFQSDPGLSDKIGLILKLNRKAFANLIEKARESGEIRPDLSSDAVFTLIVGAFRFLVLSWKTSRFSFNLTESLEKNCSEWFSLLKPFAK